MRLKNNFIVTEQDGVQILVDCGTDFHGIIKNNKTAAFVVSCLKEDTTVEEIVAKMLEKYDVDAKTAESDVLRMVETLRKVGAIEG